MMNFICAIPEEIGWAIVGFVACLCVVMAVKLGKLIVRAVRERIEENEFWAVRHCDYEED